MPELRQRANMVATPYLRDPAAFLYCPRALSNSGTAMTGPILKTGADRVVGSHQVEMQFERGRDVDTPPRHSFFAAAGVLETTLEDLGGLPGAVIGDGFVTVLRLFMPISGVGMKRFLDA